MAEPITVATARARLGIVSDHRDAEIAMLISAAREHVEDLAQTVIVAREVREPIAALSGKVHLSAWPVTGVVSIEYVDGDGNEQTIDAAAVRLGRALRPQTLEPATGTSWPADAAECFAVIEAGFEGDEIDPYPPKLLQAILVLVGLWFDDHEGVKPVPQQVRDLCAGYRRMIG